MYVRKQSTASHFEHRKHHSFGHVWSMRLSSPFRSTLNTGYIIALDTCEVCTEAVHCVAVWTQVASQLWTCVKYAPKQPTVSHFEHGLHHSFGHVWSMYRSNPFRSNSTRVTSQLWDMCEVCTEAVHCVALWTRVTSQLWTCVKYVPSSPLRSTYFENGLHHSFGHVRYVPKQSTP